MPVRRPVSPVWIVGVVALGPIIDQHQVARIDAMVRNTVAAGARLAGGSTCEGLFCRPTALAEVEPPMPAYCDEVCGPVAPVVSFSSIDGVGRGHHPVRRRG